MQHVRNIAGIGSFKWTPDEALLQWSDEVSRILGLDPEKDVASHAAWLNLVHPDDRERLRRIDQEARAGQLHSNLEYRIARPDGQIRHLTERYESDAESVGRSAAVKRIVQDVTEDKGLEERARHLQNVKAIGNLTGSIAHEFNNLLFVVLGNLELLEDCVPQDSGILQLIEAARRSEARGADLTERMLTFSRQQNLEPESLYLDHLISDTLAHLRRIVGDTIAIKIRISNSLRPVFADRGQIENALFHLATNARDAMPDGGTIVVSAKNKVVDEQQAANYPEVEAGAYVCLAVCDDCAGMTPDAVKQAATPFFTTKDAGKGAGLGLSTVFGFASQSGGFATIESQVGDGATISVYLPQAADDVEFREAARSRDAAQTILVVEDEPEVRELVSTFLRGLGYRVIEAGDGRAARAVLEGDERIDLLFSDIAMPHGMNGPQVAEIGRKLRPNLKLLFMSGYREDFLVDSGQVMPGVPIIWKPYEKEEMARMVARSLKDSNEQ